MPVIKENIISCHDLDKGPRGHRLDGRGVHFVSFSPNLDKEGEGRGNGELINAVFISDDKTTIASPK